MKRRDLLVLRGLSVEGANAFSSPYTIGIPAMTAWLGFAHAIERELRSEFGCRIPSAGFSLHSFDLQTYRDTRGRQTSHIGRAHPLTKQGERPSMFPAPIAHLEASIVLEVSDGQFIHDEWCESVKARLVHLLSTSLRLAGGSIRRWGDIDFLSVSDTADFARLRASLMPGHAVIERRELLASAEHQEGDVLDHLLDVLAVHHQPVVSSNESGDDGPLQWISVRRHPGWLVPIAVGFRGIAPLGSARNSRDNETPHRFAEAVVTLGECVMPFRLQSLDELLWSYRFDAEQALYLCTQKH